MYKDVCIIFSYFYLICYDGLYFCITNDVNKSNKQKKLVTINGCFRIFLKDYPTLNIWHTFQEKIIVRWTWRKILVFFCIWNARHILLCLVLCLNFMINFFMINSRYKHLDAIKAQIYSNWYHLINMYTSIHIHTFGEKFWVMEISHWIII